MPNIKNTKQNTASLVIGVPVPYQNNQIGKIIQKLKDSSALIMEYDQDDCPSLSDYPLTQFQELKVAFLDNPNQDPIQTILNSNGVHMTELKNYAKEFISQIDAFVGTQYGSINLPTNVEYYTNFSEWHLNEDGSAITTFELFNLVMINEAIKSGKPILGFEEDNFALDCINYCLTGSKYVEGDISGKVNYFHLNDLNDKLFVGPNKSDNLDAFSKFIDAAKTEHEHTHLELNQDESDNPSISINDVLDLDSSVIPQSNNMANNQQLITAHQPIQPSLSENIEAQIVSLG